MSAQRSENLSPRSKRKSFDFEDDITYEDFVEEEYPSDIIFPQTLNVYLRRKIQEMTSENGCLRKALQDVEEKLQLLENSLVFETSVLSKTAKEEKSTKIILLSQMCKEETVEVEALKSKCKSLDEKHIITKTQLNYQKFKNTINSKDDFNLKDQLLEKDMRIKVLNEKLNQANAKIHEMKNTNLSLKQEINKAQKVTPYRCSYRKSSSVTADLKVAENLRNLEKERRQQIENSAKELRQTEIALENNKRKLEAAKARIKVLENELCTAKRNVILLNEKKSHDDQLIEALNGQLKAVELRFLDREVEIQNQKGKFEREFAAMKNELEGAQVQNNQLRQKLEEREKEIQVLKLVTSIP